MKLEGRSTEESGDGGNGTDTPTGVPDEGHIGPRPRRGEPPIGRLELSDRDEGDTGES